MQTGEKIVDDKTGSDKQVFTPDAGTIAIDSLSTPGGVVPCQKSDDPKSFPLQVYQDLEAATEYYNEYFDINNGKPPP